MVGVLLDDIHAAIRRTTINDDILKVLGSLVYDTFDGTLQSFPIIIVDGDDGVSHNMIFYCKDRYFFNKTMDYI